MIDIFSEKVLRKYPELTFIANDISRAIDDGHHEELLYEKSGPTWRLLSGLPGQARIDGAGI